MIPFILAAVGGYLIGDSIGEDIDSKIPKFADGGSTKPKDYLLIAYNTENGTYLIHKHQDNKGGTVKSKLTKSEAINLAKELSKEMNLPILINKKNR
jgi:hypothetical protein